MASDERHVRSYADGSGTMTNRSTTSKLEATLINVEKNFGEMEIHHRFMKVSTTGVTLLLNGLCDNSQATTRRLLATYNEKIRKGVGDIEILDGFRSILCHEYQFLIKTHLKECLSEPPEGLDTDIKNFFVRCNESWNAEELSLLYDILVLQLVLWSNAQQFAQSFDRFYETHENSLIVCDEMQNIYMKVSECFADSHNLRHYLRKETCNDADLERQRMRIVTAIKSWMRQKENLEWRLLASLLPKLAIAFGSDKIASPLWSEIFDKSDDLEKTLASLCVVSDICFPSEKKMIYEIHYEQCVQKEFWSIVQQGLLSGVSQHRKQALYLAKRGVDFVGSHETAIKTKLQKTKENIVPFVCTRLPLADISVEKTKKSFFLLLEVLEEKQKHLVLPALSHLPNLVEAYNDHKSCGDCFNVIWLQCILKRMLQHDNDAINVIGLEAILKADLDIFDEAFLNFVVNALNNTFLYDWDGEDDEQIVMLLTEFFLRSEAAGVTLINAFVRAISRVSWGPVALYWVLKAMIEINFEEKIVHNIWTIEELQCITTLVSKIVMMSSLHLRTTSLMLILKAFEIYYKELANQSDLEVMVHTQSLCITNIRTNMGHFDLSESAMSRVIPSDAALYITRTCDTFFTIERHTETWAMSIFCLLYFMPSNGKDILNAEKALHRLFQKLIDADNRPYADPILIPKALEFASHLIDYASVYRNADTIKRIIFPYRDIIMKVLRRSLEKQKIERFDEYLLALKVLIDVDSPTKLKLGDPWWPDTEKQLESFEEKCIAYINGIFLTANRDHYCRTQLSYVTKVLYLCRERTFSRRPELVKMYIYSLLHFLESDSESTFNATFVTIAKIVRQIITKSPSHKWPTNIHWIEKLRNLGEIGGEEMIEPIAATLYELMEKAPSLIIQDLTTVHSIIRQFWRRAFHMRRDKDFFSAVTQLTRLIVNSNYLMLDEAKEVAFECVNEIMVEGERVPTLKRIFLDSMKSLRPQDTLEFRKSLICCLLHGAVPRRDQRIEQNTLMGAVQYYFADLELNIVRSEAIVTLLRVMTSSEATEVRNNILVDLLRILEKNKNKRYFDNSQLHRLKHRVMQTLLILEPFMIETERKLLHDTISALLIAESNQPSVRLMQEWLLTRIYIDNSVMRESIWNLFATAAEERPGSIVSFASIVYHVSKSLRGDMQLSYITKAIQHLLPNCMGQQFNVRLYSQEILVKLFQMAPVSSKYKQIYEGVEKNLRDNLKKSSIRVLDNFYFTAFDPMESYTFQIIYWDFPYLTNVCCTEWIIGTSFMELVNEETKGIRKLFDDVDLSKAKPVLQSTRATGELVEDTDLSSGGGLNDIQKKIIPWKSMVPFYDDLSETSKATLTRRKMRNEDAGIIVVASLIDRPPNLGGLARTCEIFGAKELVIGSLRYAENQEFRTLSVSAEKWITITEVKPHLLQNYLLEKQSEGWNLVGAEQTANSANLLEMEFDKKTILLLGNEKDGIPANLIPLLDKCVEIPQNGVVRSLNVHVTGAICIWQYAKQHIFT